MGNLSSRAACLSKRTKAPAIAGRQRQPNKPLVAMVTVEEGAGH